MKIGTCVFRMRQLDGSTDLEVEGECESCGGTATTTCEHDAAAGWSQAFADNHKAGCAGKPKRAARKVPKKP